jgi:phosphohistidine phosphatase
MIVYFLRHASAGQKKLNPVQDEKRPLDKEGIVQCAHVGRLLAAMEVELDAIISSPLKRATQTAALVANELGWEQKIETNAAMRPDASFDTFRRMLDDHAKRDAIMVVGHNPSLSEFLSLALSEGGNDDLVDLKKGAVAKVDLRGTKGVLNWCVTPKIARAVYDSAISSKPKTARK